MQLWFGMTYWHFNELLRKLQYRGDNFLVYKVI